MEKPSKLRRTRDLLRLKSREQTRTNIYIYIYICEKFSQNKMMEACNRNPLFQERGRN